MVSPVFVFAVRSPQGFVKVNEPLETPSINPEVDLFIIPFNLNPILCICVRFISLSAPKFNTDRQITMINHRRHLYQH